MTNTVILSGVRTPIGTFGGSLSKESPTALGAHVVKAALEFASLDPTRVGHVVMGHVINTEPRDMYLSRVAAIEAGISDAVPCLTVNRLCGSGAQAIVSAAQHLMLGDADFAIAGGAEVMSRGPHASQTSRWGQKMGDTTFVDMMIGALTDPFGTGHMGVTAENVASEHKIMRQEQDDFALESQRRASAAADAGHFDDQIIAVTLQTRKGPVEVSRDEHIKADASPAGLSSLRPVFKKEGTVTAGNASGINDGAAALVLARAGAAEAAGLKARAHILGYAHAGVRPEVMGIGPVPAVRLLMEKTGLGVDDFDVIESNEAFAAQACAVSKVLGFDPAKVNPNGGAIALGHPIGATGAILTIKCLAELERVDGRCGLITMCIGGGQGIALAIERV